MAPETTAAKLQAPALPAGTRRNLYLIPIWLLFTINLYWLYWLYQTYKEVRAHSPAATKVTPGRAVGFLFIPFLNVYWVFRVFVDFPRAIARLQRHDPRGEEVLLAPAITVLTILGFLMNASAVGLGPGSLLIGEALFCCAFVACQTTLNAHWSGHASSVPVGPGPASSSKRFAQLIGVPDGPPDWARIAAFTAGVCALNAAGPWLSPLVESFSASLLSLNELLPLLGYGLLTAGTILIAFRFLSNVFAASGAAAGASTLVFVVVEGSERSVLQWVLYLSYEFIFALVLAGAVRWLRPLPVACASTALVLATWLVVATPLLGWEGLLGSVRLEDGVSYLLNAVAFAAVFSLGLKLAGRSTA